MSLQHLQQNLSQVHYGSNEERAAAQVQLSLYETKASPRDIFLLIRTARESTVLAFLLSALEKILLDKGESLQPDERSELRNFVLEFAVAGARAKNPLDKFILNKAGKIIVDCAKLDWPTYYSNFFEQMIQLCNDNTGLKSFGIKMLVIALEELPSRSSRRGRDIPLTNARRVEFQKGIESFLPQIVPTITSMLNDQSVCSIAIDALSSLFSSDYVALQNQVSGQLMDSLFQIMSNSNHPQCSTVINCLTQMIGRNCIPNDAEGFVMKVATQMLSTLQSTVDSAKNTGGMLTNMSEDVLLELVRFLTMFLERHLCRVERNEQFPLNNLLALLFDFSFLLPTPELFLEVLSVWTVFIDFVACGKCNGSKRPTYIQGLSSFSGKLIERMLHSSCKDFLSVLNSDAPTTGRNVISNSATSPQKTVTALNNTSSSSSSGSSNNSFLNDGNMLWNTPEQGISELDEYINKSVVLIHTLTSLPGLVSQLLSTVVPALQTRCNTIFQNGSSGIIFNDDDARDLATLCSIIAASSGHFVSTFQDTVQSTFGVYSLILEISYHILSTRAWSKGHNTLALLLETLKTLGTFSTWLGNCVKCGIQAVQQNVLTLLEKTASLVKLALDVSVSPSPEVLLVTTVQLARSLLVRAKLSSQIAGRLYTELIQSMNDQALPQPVRERICACVAEVVLDGVASTGDGSERNVTPPDSQFKHRASGAINTSNSTAEEEQIRQQFNQCMQPFVQHLVSASQENSGYSIRDDSQLQNRVRSSAGNMSAVSWARRNAPRKQKRLVFSCFRPALEATGRLLHLCLTPTVRITRNSNNISNSTPTVFLSGMRTAKQLVHFLRLSIDALRDEIGIDTLCAIIVALCGVVKSYLLNGLINGTCTPSSSLLSLLVSIFQLFAVAIDHQSRKFRKVLPHVLSAISDFDVALFQSNSSIRQVLMSSQAGISGLDDVITIRFALFRCCLLQHWSFFMGSKKMNQPCDPMGFKFFQSSMNEILNVFNQTNSDSSSSGDRGGGGGGVSLIRVQYNLATLRELHRVHNLFTVCPPELRIQCLTVCLNMIASTSMELLRDEIVVLIHTIASFHFRDFFNVFVPQYVANTFPGNSVTNFQKEKLCAQFAQDADAISFAENAYNFTNYLKTLKEMQKK